MNMGAIKSGILPLHDLLSTTVKQASVLEGLSNASLLSIGQLCDDNCIAIFDKQNLHVFKNGQCIVKGIRNWTNGLWDINIKKEEHANIIIRKVKP